MLSLTKSRLAGKTFLQTLFFFLLVTQICFAQWYQQTSGTTKNLYAVQFTDGNNGIAVGDSGIILRTINGGTIWTPVPSGTAKDFNSICFVDANNSWAVAGDKCHYFQTDSSIILHSTDGGTTWTSQLIVLSANLNNICFVDVKTGFAVGHTSDSTGWHSIFLKTTNGGLSWVQQSHNTYVPLTDVHFVDSNTGWIHGFAGVMWGYESYIYKSEDGGASWSLKLANHGGGPKVPGDPAVFDIFFRDTNSGVAIGGQYYGGGIIYRTTDGSDSWIDTIALGNGPLSKVYFNDTNHGTAVGLDGSIYQTTDSGVTWNLQTSGTANALKGVYFVDDLNGWVVGDNGTVLHTTNGGVPVELASFTATANGKVVILNWSTATELNNQGFEIQRSTEGEEFFTIGFVNGHGTTTEQQNYSYADRNLDDGNYYYRLKQVDYDGSYECSDVVEIDYRGFNSYLLEQNFPNPFNPSTTIGFGIQNKSNVKITILNAIGEEVAVVINEERESGFHRVEFNAATLPSGVYFYQLKAGEYTSVKKMILLK
jgi:photosystem II stability/assembly factor-like uncharacterized protein